MKKLMFAALAAVAMVGVAKAAQSYGILAENYVSPYSKDTNPGEEHSGWYSSFVMKQGDAQAAMKTSATVTYETMAEWLGKNFDANKASVIANAERIDYSAYASKENQYSFKKEDDTGSGLASAIGVFFYNDGENVAYSVLPNTFGHMFAFDDSQTVAAGSGWLTPSDVPEPTSGLLMLLGVAGLALKRKRA